MNHVSLKDVARRAGVSFQTAGKVLNNKGTVSAATRQRILAAADELGYVPNALARGLITRSTAVIGVVASDLSQTVLTQPVVGIEREARRQGHAVIIGSVDRDGRNAPEVVRRLLEQRVDGIILVAPMIEENVEIATYLRGKLPVVSTHDLPGGGVPVIHVDDEAVGRLVGRHLIALGHRQIGTIIGAPSRHVTGRRLAGYRHALVEAGIPVDERFVDEGQWEVEGGYQATHRLLDRCPTLTAIFAHNDLMAVGVLAALHDRGWAVPGDCAVIGCDDIPVGARTIPPLTTMHLPFYDVGEQAARLLFTLVAGQTDPPPETLLAPSLVYRASCGTAQPSGGRRDPARPTDHSSTAPVRTAHGVVHQPEETR